MQQIYYFSRTGRSKAIAEQLASRYDTAARMIDDHELGRKNKLYESGGNGSYWKINTGRLC